MEQASTVEIPLQDVGQVKFHQCLSLTFKE